jgi:eukaryotic-like serine/threonine-protein kinase
MSDAPEGPRHPIDSLGLPSTESFFLGEAFVPEPPPVADALERGTAVGRYLILDRIGSGGMGVVYSAFDPELDRKVALKLLRPDRGVSSGEPGRLRLLREAQAIARLSHPNVVAVYDAGSFGRQVFVAMELVEGSILRRWLEEEKPSWREALQRFLLAGRGLAAAHAAGLVHRDFKPDNVLLGKDGRVRVVDFGLARPLGEPREPMVEGEEGGSGQGFGILSSPLTQWGMILGTPAYMAPEQLRGEAADARSDQFSFCVSLYEALYGERPFAGDGPRQIGEAVARGEIRGEPARTRVPGRLRAALLRGLSSDPERRYPSMEELLHELERDPAARRRRWLAVAAVVLGTGALFAGLGYFQADRGRLCSGAEKRLVGIWDADRQGAVRAAFLATRLPFAESAAREVSGKLDRYTQSWVATRREACEATQVRGEQSAGLLDRRMLCLDQRLQQVEALVGLLSRADAPTVRRSSGLLDALDDVADCAAPAALLQKVPLPRDPVQRAQVRRLQAQLARAQLLESAGQFQPALALATALDRQAATVSYAPLQADVAFLVGALRERTGEIQVAERDLYRALAFAEAGRDDIRRALCWKKLIYIVGIRQGRVEEAHRLAQLARAALARAGGDPRWEAEILDVEASLYGYEGRSKEARAGFEQALAIFARIHQDPPYSTLSNLGTFYRFQGDSQRAYQYFHQALDQARTTLGDLHADTASLEFNVSTALLDQQRFGEAETYLRRALAKRERILGPDHVDVAETLIGFGTLWDSQGRPDRSLPYQERALRIYSAKTPGSVSWALAQNNVGDALRKLGRYEEAVEHLRAGLEGTESRSGAESFIVAALLDTLGSAYLDWGKADEAIPPLERAMAIRGQQAGPDLLADTQFSLARALWITRRNPARALSLAHQARAGYLQSGDPYRERVAEVDAWLSHHEIRVWRKLG